MIQVKNAHAVFERSDNDGALVGRDHDLFGMMNRNYSPIRVQLKRAKRRRVQCLFQCCQSYAGRLPLTRELAIRVLPHS